MARTVLVSGGSSGIGAATAGLAAARGWTVLIAYRSGQRRAEALAAEIAAAGGRAVPIELPIEDAARVPALIEAAARHAASLDALVLSASPAPAPAPFAKTDPEALREQLAVNAVGAHSLIAACWNRWFKQSRDGLVVGLLTSALGPPPAPDLSAYVAAKGALRAILECAAAELGPKGLRVGAVSPTYTDTPMLHSLHPHRVEAARERQPGGRFLTAEEVARRVVGLLETPPPAGRFDIVIPHE